MVRLFCAIAFIVFIAGTPALSENLPPAFSAGVVRLSVSDIDGPFDTMVWYPISGPETPWQAGPFTVDASLNGAIARDKRFPIVIFSHGSGGTPLGHRELLSSLARAGFVVVSPVHLGDAAGHPRARQQAQILMARPRQAQEALNAVLADDRFAGHIDADHMGMIGYSAGGYTTLVLAGARPNFAFASAYCAGEGRNDIGSCGPAKDRAAEADGPLQTWQPPIEPRLKAIVLMDPLSMLFDRAALAPLRMPALLLRPQDDSYLNAAHNALALARDLPSPPDAIVVPGRHFVFIDPCPQALMTQAAALCQDAPGVDRASIHLKIEADIVSFLRQHL